MTIDFHAHLAQGGEDAPPFMRAMFDPEAYLEAQEAAGIELTVLSNAPPDLRGTAAELDEARRQHDFLGALVAAHPSRLAALAAVDPFGGPTWLQEGERALDAGFAGLCLPVGRDGKYLDLPEAQDALALAAQRGVVVLLHPSQSPVDGERFGHGMLAGWIGQPYDTGISLARMLLADTLGRHPGLRVVVAHCGGTLPMLLGRIDRVYQQMARMGGGGPGAGPPGAGPPGAGAPGPGPDGPGRHHGPPGAAGGATGLTPSLEGPPPSERLGRVYLDTAGYHRAALTAALAAVGPERVVVGTDYPPAGPSPAAALGVLAELDLEPAARQAILSGTARALLAGAPIR